MSFKAHLKSFCPPILSNIYNSVFRRGVQFSGQYASWEAASSVAVGYDANSILNQAIAATRKVVSGEASSERDGMTFSEANHPFPLITFLLMAADNNDRQLTVVDFGGALGSTYLQCKYFLNSLKTVRWCVVEQPHYVDAGNQHFSTDSLLFFSTIAAAVTGHRPSVVLFSGSLQYLPDPYAVLNEAIDSGPDYIVVDRTPFIDQPKSLLSLQKIPKQIVESSYPVWLFSETEFRRIFSNRYSEVAKFYAIDGTIGRRDLKARFKGIVFRKNESKVRA